jgi:2-hydroxy-3-oxopropionate reductase
MALNLLRGGHQLAVWARRPESLQPLLAAGAVAVRRRPPSGGAVKWCFTMLTAGADVEQRALGLDGLAEGLAAASLLVDMSTIAPGMARSLAQRLGERGHRHARCAGFRGWPGAIAASLAIMVGGKAAVLERARPLLALLGKTIVHVGDNGAGQVAKACNQMMMVGAIQAVAEALHFSAAPPAPIRPGATGPGGRFGRQPGARRDGRADGRSRLRRRRRGAPASQGLRVS